MPLVTDAKKFPSFAKRLERRGIPYLSREAADEQEIHPIKVALANLMPAKVMQETELQWLRWFGESPVLQVEPLFLKLTDDPREKEGGNRAKFLKKYSPLKVIMKHDPDILVVTGDNLETKEDTVAGGRVLTEPEDIRYHKELNELMDKSSEVPVVVFSCLAAHYALFRFHDLQREIPDGNKKTHGVFDHEIVDLEAPVTRGMGNVMRAPHSRWGNITVEQIENVPELKVLAMSEKVGWLVLQETLDNGNVRIYIQGHPEYGKFDLDGEYKRDQAENPDANVPEGYYPNDDPTQEPIHNWQSDARALHQNILGVAYQMAEDRRHSKENFSILRKAAIKASRILTR